jgi:hypothetical protein
MERIMQHYSDMIIMTVITIWFVGSLALVLALARAAGRALPQPDWSEEPCLTSTVVCGSASEPLGQEEANAALA